MSTNTTTESGVLQAGPKIDDQTLLDIQSFDDALIVANDVVGEIADAGQTLGNGFAVLDNKDSLIGIPCLFMSWHFNLGDFGEFVSAYVVARSESGGARKVIVNDGSTGIYKQLSEFTERSGKMGGLMARHGLTRSDYEYDNGDGKKTPARTYYIDTTS